MLFNITGNKFYWADLARQALVFVFFGLLALALIGRGAASPLISSFISFAFSVIVCISLISQGEPKSTSKVLRSCFLVAAGLVGWIMFQAVPSSSLAHPAWRDVSQFLIGRSGAISVAPADSLAASLSLALPFIVFLGALALFPSDYEARRLLAYLGYLGGILAGYAIFEFNYSPDTLLGGEKHFYLDSLTAPFVNRNTAGTFYGLISLILSTKVYMTLFWPSMGSRGAETRNYWVPTKTNWSLVVDISLLSFCLIALFLTKSRGAIGSTFVSYLIYVSLLASAGKAHREFSSSFADRRRQSVRKLMRVIFGLGGIVLVGAIFADRALYRAEVQGLDDGRFCVLPSILQAISNSPLAGVGFGTFRLFFPAVRDPQCGVYGIWDRAHSVYLEGYLGLGPVFVLALVVGAFGLGGTFVRGLRTRQRLRVYPVLGFAALSLVAVHSAIDFSLQIPGFAVTFAASIAAVVTISSGRLNATV